MALTDVVFEQANSAFADRGNIGVISDSTDKYGFSIPFYVNAWYGSTYSISGVVTLAAVGVVGAEVTVIVADDTNLTNAYLHATVITTSGGAWSANIPTGKLAYAYAQNFTGGVYYTAAGAPYIS